MSKLELKWRAIYDDDAVLEQYNKDGTENKYADINRDKLARFDMLRVKDDFVVLSLYLREGQRLIYRRRSFIRSDGARWKIYIVGWQMTVMTSSGPKNITTINYIYEDGSIALDGARDNLELLRHEM